jgi:hypothetical protein
LTEFDRVECGAMLAELRRLTPADDGQAAALARVVAFAERVAIGERTDLVLVFVGD